VLAPNAQRRGRLRGCSRGRIKNGNVEISALINLGFDDLHTGKAKQALPYFEDILVRAGEAFGAHRWRWSIHVMFGLAATLLELDRDAEALAQADRGLAPAEGTDVRKYIGWFRLLRGEVALRAGDAARATAELDVVLRVAREIGYPTLTWRAAHALAQAQAVGGTPADALASAQLAANTIARIGAAAPEHGLRETLLAWPRVQAVHETLERIRLSA